MQTTLSREFKLLRAALAALLAVAGASVAIATSPPAVTAVPVGKTVEWDSAKDGARRSYAVGDLKLTFSIAKNSDGDALPVLTVLSPRYGRRVMLGQVGLAAPMASFVVARLDPQASGPAVVLETFTGGAHCCTQIDILDPVGGGWTPVDAGAHDGSFSIGLHDLDGDGAPDIRLGDEAFLYSFACYACAAPPLRIYNLVGGQWRDVSTARKYIPTFRKAEAADRRACVEGGGQDGACATFVAEAARAGDFPAAWAWMLKHYDRKDEWDWPTGCTAPRDQDHACPKGHEIAYKTYPEALEAFLIETKYIPAG